MKFDENYCTLLIELIEFSEFSEFIKIFSNFSRFYKKFSIRCEQNQKIWFKRDEKLLRT